MPGNLTRAAIIIHGAVQGVGFRPFIYRLANSAGLKGYIQNSNEGVYIEAEGYEEDVNNFILRIESDKPPLARIISLEYSLLGEKGYGNFEIKLSDNSGKTSALIMPDIATCPECLAEIFDPGGRRYLYPFTNCTNCGPRYSVITALPYDRKNTTMREFHMCSDCAGEYNDPADRRFHAQPIACPGCGPRLELTDSNGIALKTGHEALLRAAEEIRKGSIIALKGLGGFQLIADASNSETINKLRMRKRREEKPFAIMAPDIEYLRQICEMSDTEERSVLSVEAPIVLLKRKIIRGNIEEEKKGKDKRILIPSPETAPGNPYLGAMLPYTPLHHILMKELNFAILATSGNLSEEPICIDSREAYAKLSGIADFFLVHDRPIARHVDDSIVRVVLNRQMIMRRARGFAPLPVEIENHESGSAQLSVGGHLKNTAAINIGGQVYISQHIGDLSTNEAYSTFKNVINDLKEMFRVEPGRVICDKHPDYLSHQYATTLGSPVKTIQHHIAHIAACRAENGVEGAALGVAFDGTGYGEDSSIWGGEFFISGQKSFEHIGRFRQFPLPGGDSAAKEPRRSALGMIYEIFGNGHFEKSRIPVRENHGFFSDAEIMIMSVMLRKKINTPLTSSVGRIFDAVASLAGLNQVCTFEAQAAMQLEFEATDKTKESYQFKVIKKEKYIIDWEPMIRGILDDLAAGENTAVVATKFHNTIAKTILDMAILTGEKKVLLSGGCFQNVVLLEKTVALLRCNDFNVYWHQRIPCNDGGLSYGQLAASGILGS